MNISNPGEPPTKELFIPISFPGTGGVFNSAGNFAGIFIDLLNDKTFGHLIIPIDFTAVVEAVLLVVPGATQAAAEWTLMTQYAAPGENYTTHSETDATGTFDVTADCFFEVDFSGLLMNLVARDILGVRMILRRNGDSARVLGIRFKYA